jgi:uncharacterized lipoprotein YajG
LPYSDFLIKKVLNKYHFMTWQNVLILLVALLFLFNCATKINILILMAKQHKLPNFSVSIAFY